MLPMRSTAQSGSHIVWHCSLHRYERARNRITGTNDWQDLDGKIWVPNEERRGDDDEQQVDGIECFFEYLAYQF